MKTSSPPVPRGESLHAASPPVQRGAGMVLLVLSVLLLVSIVLSAGIGSVLLHPIEILRVLWHHLGGHVRVEETTDNIVWNMRLPRIALALLVGAALAVAGVLMQALFHNPMADPYIVGVSSGAALGAVIVFSLGMQASMGSLNAVSLAAFLGGLAVTMLVYGLSRRGGRVPVSTLLLTGIALGSLMQAVTAFMLLQRPGNEMHEVMAWLMGSLAYKEWPQSRAAAVYLIGAVLALLRGRELNILALGDDTAHYLGVSLERTELLLLLIASLLAAAAVAVSGIIAFVGLIIPHLMRLLVGPNHRVLLPACLLCGGLLLIWADVLARTLIPGGELPIGIVTSVLGSPFFLYLLHRRERRWCS